MYSRAALIKIHFFFSHVRSFHSSLSFPRLAWSPIYPFSSYLSLPLSHSHLICLHIFMPPSLHGFLQEELVFYFLLRIYPCGLYHFSPSSISPVLHQKSPKYNPDPPSSSPQLDVGVGRNWAAHAAPNLAAGRRTREAGNTHMCERLQIFFTLLTNVQRRCSIFISLKLFLSSLWASKNWIDGKILWCNKVNKHCR